MKRLFRRLWFYWPGVPGMVLLLLVWWDSGGYESMVHVASGDKEDRVRLQFGSIWWERTKEWRPGGVTLDHFSTERSALQSERMKEPRGRKFDLPPALYRFETSFGGSTFRKDVLIVQLGLWVIAAGYSVMWAVMVFGWHHRKRRRAKRLVELQATAG